MFEFLALAIILFFILLINNAYYQLLLKRGLPKPSKVDIDKKGMDKKTVLRFAFVLILILMASLAAIYLLSRNFLIFYLGLTTLTMLAVSIYTPFQNRRRWLLVSCILALSLVSLQLFLKTPLLGNLLITAGYMGIAVYTMQNKIVNPKLILAFLTFYTLYDLVGVAVVPLQTTLAEKTINNIFPSALAVGDSFIGNGDILFALLMTAFSRTYYGLSIGIVSALLFSIPLVLLEAAYILFPDARIAVPYLVLITPTFLGLVFLMRKRGFSLS